jgi:hypothetical protein
VERLTGIGVSSGDAIGTDWKPDDLRPLDRNQRRADSDAG